MKKSFCDRCGGEGTFIHPLWMYGLERDYVAFGKYIYPDGHLCKSCRGDFQDFLEGKPINSVKAVSDTPTVSK